MPENPRRCASGRDVTLAIDLLERSGVEEGSLRRVIELGVEISAELVQFNVVRPVAEAHAIFQREVPLQFPAVLREGVGIPVPPCAGRLTGRWISVHGRPLDEGPNSTDEHIGSRVSGARVIIGTEPQLTGLVVLEVLLLLTAFE